MQTRPRLQSSQAPGLDKEKEWTSKQIELRLVGIKILDISMAFEFFDHLMVQIL